jgi:hypothetical protein
MAGILNYISHSFFHNPVKSDPTETHWTYNITFKFTSMTGTFLFFASCLVFVREVIGDHIHCIADATSGGGPVSIITLKFFLSVCLLKSFTRI